MMQAGINTGQGLVQSGIQSLFNLGLMKRENRYQKEMMKLQDQYQRKMMLDNMSLVKQSLMRAGYSTADPSGTGTSAPTVSAPSSSASGQVSAPSMPGIDIGALGSQIAQARNLNSVAKLNEIEAQFKETELQSNIDYVKAQTKAIVDKLPGELKILDQNLQNLVANKQLTDEQKNKAVNETKLLVEQIASIQYENKYKDKKEYYNAEAAAEAFRKLSFEADIEGMKAYMAGFGIVPGYNLFQTVVGMAMNLDQEALDQLENSVHTIVKDMPDTASNLIDVLFSTIRQVPKKVLFKLWDKLKGLAGAAGEWLDEQNSKLDEQARKEGRLP